MQWHLFNPFIQVARLFAELGRQLQMPPNRVSAIIKGLERHDGRRCFAPGHFFRTSSQFWLKLQSLYELRLAQQHTGEAVRALPTLLDRGKLSGEVGSLLT